MPNGTPKALRGLATSACAPKLNATHDLVGPNDRLLRVKPFQFLETSTETANDRWDSRNALAAEALRERLEVDPLITFVGTPMADIPARDDQLM